MSSAPPDTPPSVAAQRPLRYRLRVAPAPASSGESSGPAPRPAPQAEPEPSATAFPSCVDPRQLPLVLSHALRDEAHVRICLGILQSAIKDTRAQIQALSAGITHMDTLYALANRPRPAFAARKALEYHCAKLDKAASAANLIEAQLAALAESLLETHVRATNPAYVKGLAAMNNWEDWTRALGRFEGRVHEFAKALGQARNGVVAGYRHTEQQISHFAEKQVGLALDAAVALESEVDFINRLSAMHLEMIAATPCATASIPTVPASPYQAWLAALIRLPIGPMQAEFARLIGELETLEKEGVNALTAAVGQCRETHSGIARSYVLQELALLRSFADQHLVNPDEAQAAIVRLEQRFFRSRMIDFEFVPGQASPAT